MGMFEMFSHKNKNEEVKAEGAENVSEANVAEKEAMVKQLNSVMEEIKAIDPEKIARNAEKEALKSKLKFAGALLTTLGLGAGLVLAFAQRVGAIEVVDVAPMVNEIAMGVTFIATCFSAGSTQMAYEKMNAHKSEVSNTEDVDMSNAAVA